jgi:hypothetical protein
VFENWVQRKVLGLNGEGVTGDWRQLHIEELMACMDQVLLGL